MVSIVPLNTDNTYLAREFLIKDPYKNARMYSLLENDGGNSLIIYDSGVIRGILAVDKNKMEIWFYGNRGSFKVAIENIELNNKSSLFIDSKNLDIAKRKFRIQYSTVLVMRLKIRDYIDESGNASRVTLEESEEYIATFGVVPNENTFIKMLDGKIVGAASVLSHNIKVCTIGCIKYEMGNEDPISEIVSSIVNEYKTFTENIVVYAIYDEKLKDMLGKLGFTYSGELLKLYKSG